MSCCHSALAQEGLRAMKSSGADFAKVYVRAAVQPVYTSDPIERSTSSPLILEHIMCIAIHGSSQKRLSMPTCTP